MNSKVLVVFFSIVITQLSCANVNKDSVEVSCDIKKIDGYEISDMNGYLLNDLLKCGRSEEAFDLINKHVNNFTVQDYAVTGDVLLTNNYIDESKKFLDIAASHNDGEAQQRLGVIYSYVLKYKDLNKAIYYLKESLENDYTYSTVTLADIYVEENSIKDLNLAMKYSEDAIKSGYKEANYYLFKIYADEKKYDIAKDKLNLLKKDGYIDYYELGLSELYSSYKDYEGYNPAQAKKILDGLVLSSNDTQRYRWLADFYMEDHEFYNKTKALNYYEKAYSQGDWISEQILSQWDK